MIYSVLLPKYQNWSNEMQVNFLLSMTFFAEFLDITPSRSQKILESVCEKGNDYVSLAGVDYGHIAAA